MNTMYFGTRATRRRERIAKILCYGAGLFSMGIYWILVCTLFAT